MVEDPLSSVSCAPLYGVAEPAICLVFSRRSSNLLDQRKVLLIVLFLNLAPQSKYRILFSVDIYQTCGAE
jgi:hypothetical protein